MLLLAIDPSVNNIGVALYDTTLKKLRTRLIHPNRTFRGAAESQSMVHLSIYVLRAILIEFLSGKQIDKLVIEYPNWQRSTKGLIAMQQGYTLDLAFLAGVLATGFKLCAADVYTPTPLQWKGNIPKDATKLRVQKEFGILQISEHEYDAVGMMQWLKKQPGCAE